MPQLQFFAASHDVDCKLGAAFKPFLIAAHGVANKNPCGSLGDDAEQRFVEINWSPIYRRM